MATVQDLVNFIEQNPPAGKDWNWVDWSKALDQSVPGWQDIVKNPDNWPDIEKARARSDLYSLRKAFLRCAGVGLANRWFKSRDPDLAEVVDAWLDDVFPSLSRLLSVEVWRGLKDELKRVLVLRIFDTYPGEPFETLRHFPGHLRHFPEIWVPLPMTGYIPSRQVLELRDIVEAAGDHKFLKLIDELIAQREKACQSAQVPTPRIPYTPSRDERELIARVIDKVRQGGSGQPCFPR